MSPDRPMPAPNRRRKRPRRAAIASVLELWLSQRRGLGANLSAGGILGGRSALKPREPRRKVLITARMKVGASWADACILNVSTCGMLVQSGTVPDRGNYLEIRRGQHVVIARVVWSNQQRFGVRTQDPVCAEELLGETDNSSTTADRAPIGFERRTSRRPVAARHEAGRRRGRALEFASLAVFGAASAFLVFATVNELLSRPLRALHSSLVARPAG